MSTYYEAQERALAPGIADGWPQTIPAPHTPNGRLIGTWIDLDGKDAEDVAEEARAAMRPMIDGWMSEAEAFDTDERRANARLIAAAPAMLAALEAVNEWRDLLRQDYPEIAYHFTEKVAAALAQARGEKVQGG